MEFNHEAPTVCEACGYTDEEILSFLRKVRETAEEKVLSRAVENVMKLLEDEKKIAMLVHWSLSNAKVIEQMGPLARILGGDTVECQCEDCVAERSGKVEEPRGEETATEAV